MKKQTYQDYIISLQESTRPTVPDASDYNYSIIPQKSICLLNQILSIHYVPGTTLRTED